MQHADDPGPSPHDRARRRRPAAVGRPRPARGSPATRPCRSSGSRCWCCRATATPHWSCLGSRPRGWSSSPTCSRSWRGTRPTIRSSSWPGWRARPTTAAIGDRTWARFLLDLQAPPAGDRVQQGQRRHGPAARGEGRRRDRWPFGGPRAAADRVAAELQAGEIPLVGRTEAEVSADIARRLVAEGHQHVNFAIVGSGPNAASPHHDADDRVIQAGEVVLCDFGGTMRAPEAGGIGYCSDITRCVWTGGVEPPSEFRDLYAVLHDGTAGRGRSRHRRHTVRGRRRRRPPDHHRRRVRAELHPPHRPRHRHRGARGPVHRRGQLRGARAGPRLLGRARHLLRRASGERDSRTSSWPPTTGPTRSTPSSTISSSSMPDRPLP